MKLPYKFGKYVLIQKIANGGMAEIYRAKFHGERGFAKDYAVKMILPHRLEDKNFQTMLVDEARALVHLQHQNIVQVHELGINGKCYFISMEYVDGADLRKIYDALEKERRTLPEEFACFIIAEILKALEFAHRQKGDDGGDLNIVHRDISPQNILVSNNGEVKLTDFGIAKGLHREEETTTNQLKGKYAYMSPEQACGGKVDLRSDIYSAGIVLYEIITGSRLFKTDSDFETIQNVRESRLPESWEIKVSLNMRQILKKALARDPDDRYQTAAEFLKDINRYITFKKLHTHALELADFLKTLSINNEFKEAEELPPQQKTKILTRVSKKGAKRAGTGMPFLIVLITIFASLFITDSVMSKKSINEVAVKKPEEVIVNTPQIPSMPSVGGGVINIDTVPSKAQGSIEIGGRKINFTTPYVLADIDVEKDVDAEIVINKEGFRPVRDFLKITKAGPSAHRTYPLESTAPARLSVNARPWGYVYIPGVIDKKESPVVGMDIRPGSYEIKVSYPPGGEIVRTTLNMAGNRRYKCLADFTKKGSIYCE